MQSYNLSNIHFLLVEHNAYTRKLLKLILNTFRCRNIREAETGVEALEILQDLYRPDIIITDWQMPVMDGIELVRILRRGDAGADPFVPIIMVTAHTDKGHILMARDSGVNEILALPVSPKMLYSRIARVIEQPRPFVRSKSYFGPDRRRHQDRNYAGPDRRKQDPG